MRFFIRKMILKKCMHFWFGRISSDFILSTVVSRLFKWMMSICHSKYREPGMCEFETLQCSEKREFGKLRAHCINHSELTWYIFFVQCNLFYRLPNARPNITCQLNSTSNRKFYFKFQSQRVRWQERPYLWSITMLNPMSIPFEAWINLE